jgi:hypothetical protein
VKRMDDYVAQLLVSGVRAWRVAWIVAVGWALFPFAVATVLHPSDVIRLQAALQGLPQPHSFTSQQLGSGLMQAVFVFGVLVLVQLVGTALFYRRARLTHAGPVAIPALWPLAAIVPGVVGNAGWWLASGGTIDPVGILIGFSPVALTVVCEWVINGLGRDFVFGQAQGAHPPVNQSW